MSWTNYYRFTEGRKISPLLVQALDALAGDTADKAAIDLGCGAGHECRVLLNTGWRVHAIDSEPAAIEGLRPLASPAPGALTLQACRFEDLSSLPAAHLIHAGLSLPFCHPECFDAFWSLVRSALRPGGVFAGHFFGPRDAWADSQSMSFHSRDQVLHLLDGMELVAFKEFDGMAPSMRGPKHWHRFDVVARRPVSS